MLMENKVIEQAVAKTEYNVNKLKNKYPHITIDGNWQKTEDGCWTGGFWIGLLWLLYGLTKDERFVQWPYKWLQRLEQRKNDRTFDLGFLFYPSFVLGYKVTNDNYLRKVALDAADTLMTFSHERLGFIHDEVAIENKMVGRAIVDIMMNLPLLWWAYEETGDRKYYNAAYIHSRQTIKHFIKDECSTIHAIDFDLETGEIIKKFTLQGYGDSSCWARGQAWAVYGFALAYKTSGERRFLEIAENLARYFMQNLPDDYVPYWDFDDPNIPYAIRDTSAAAITCSGLLTLYELNKKEEFAENAMKIFNSLTRNYLAGKSDAILKHGCYHKKNNGLIWCDYYFVESLTKVISMQKGYKDDIY